MGVVKSVSRFMDQYWSSTFSNCLLFWENFWHAKFFVGIWKRQLLKLIMSCVNNLQNLTTSLRVSMLLWKVEFRNVTLEISHQMDQSSKNWSSNRFFGPDLNRKSINQSINNKKMGIIKQSWINKHSLQNQSHEIIDEIILVIQSMSQKRRHSFHHWNFWVL